MKLLRRALYVEAALVGTFGIVLVLLPGWLLESVLGQEPLPEYAWVRMLGVFMIGMAMLMVIVGHRVEETWWFAWAFVLVFAGVAALATGKALFRVSVGSSVAAWWVVAALATAFAVAMLVGLGRTGLERPAD